MGGRSGFKNQRGIPSKSQHGQWVAQIDKDTGVIKWLRKKIKKKKK